MTANTLVALSVITKSTLFAQVRELCLKFTGLIKAINET
ncbi:hypothetical protein VC87395_003453 [Vibrio paracholerae 87395]|nr:hypothetical protein VC87395_003453 [Vibrio paracholerae 87395]